MVSFPEVERQMETAMLGVFTAGKRPHSLVFGLHSPKPFQNLDFVRNYILFQRKWLKYNLHASTLVA